MPVYDHLKFVEVFYWHKHIMYLLIYYLHMITRPMASSLHKNKKSWLHHASVLLVNDIAKLKVESFVMNQPKNAHTLAD